MIFDEDDKRNPPSENSLFAKDDLVILVIPAVVFRNTIFKLDVGLVLSIICPVIESPSA